MNWRAWIRACLKDPHSPINLPRGRQPLAPLTSQDTRALDAIVACWKLYFSGDYDAEHGALAAVRALLPALQPSTRMFARELIPFCGDWDHREKLWPLVTDGGELLDAKPRRGRPLPPPGSYFCPKCETDRRLSEPCVHIKVSADVRPILCEIGANAEAKTKRMQVIIPEGAPPGHYTVIPPFEFPDDDEGPVKAALLEVADALSVRADERNTVEEIKTRCIEQGRAFADIAWQRRQAVADIVWQRQQTARVSNTNETAAEGLDDKGAAVPRAVHVCTDPRCAYCHPERRH